MKKKLLIFLLFIPLLVNASSFNSATGIANRYINNFLNPNRYINVDKGDLISKEEVEKTIVRPNMTVSSYMYDGTKFWAKDKYIIGETIEKKDGGDAKTKVTEIVLHDTKVKGTGKYTDPWIFVDTYNITVKSSGNGTVDGQAQVLKKAVASGSVSFTLEPKTGYKYLNNNCGSTSDVVGNTLKISNIEKDIECIVSFETSKYSNTLPRPYSVVHINLTNSNTTYWFDGLSPNTFSSRYTLGYYTDDTLKTRIGKLTSLPSRKGWKFNGYYVKRSNFDKIDQIASTDDLLINSNGFFETTYGLLKDNDTKEIIGFSVEPNRYKISFDANGGSGGTTVIKDWPYEHDMPTITLPGRAGYTFEGYYTAASGGDRYYNANGTESRIFNPSTPGDLKLYAHWTICPAGSYCPGDNSARGCPSGYTSSTGASNIHDCFNYLRAYKTCYSYNSGTYTGVGHTCVLGTSGWYYNTYTKTGMSFCHASSQDCACSGNEGYDGCGYYSSCTPEISYGWGGQNSNYTVSCSTSSFGCNSSHVNWEYTISCTKHNY